MVRIFCPLKSEIDCTLRFVVITRNPWSAYPKRTYPASPYTYCIMERKSGLSTCSLTSSIVSNTAGISNTATSGIKVTCGAVFCTTNGISPSLQDSNNSLSPEPLGNLPASVLSDVLKQRRVLHRKEKLSVHPSRERDLNPSGRPLHLDQKVFSDRS